MDYNALTYMSYGLYVVSAWDKGRATGCTANSVMQITAEPPMLAISINHDNYTHACIKDTNRFAVSILKEDSDPQIISRFGFRNGKDINKFDDKIEQRIFSDMPVIKDSVSVISCEVTDSVETETHTIFIAKVIDAEIIGEGVPMTYSYYQKVIKGKSPKTAPTYIPKN